MKHDQHFMIDKELAGKIVDYLKVSKSESVIEIGPGKGVLTEFLTAKTSNLKVIEIDKELCVKLKERFTNLEVVSRNVLNFKELEADKIIGNLPYSISEPFMNLLVRSKFKLGVFTVPISFMSDGFLQRIMKIFFVIKKLDIIEKKSFRPEPKVKSKVIRITPRRLKQKGQLIKEIYLQTDKTLKNALRESYCKVYSMTKKEALKNIPELRFLDKKVYTLNADEWKILLESLNMRQ